MTNKILIYTTLLLLPYFAQAGDSTSGGFLHQASIRAIDLCTDMTIQRGDSTSGGFMILNRSACELTDGNIYRASKLIDSTNPKLRRDLVDNIDLENEALDQTSEISKLFLRASALNNYGGYGEEEAIEAVVEAPEEAEAEVRQIIYSL